MFDFPGTVLSKEVKKERNFIFLKIQSLYPVCRYIDVVIEVWTHMECKGKPKKNFRIDRYSRLDVRTGVVKNDSDCIHNYNI